MLLPLEQEAEQAGETSAVRLHRHKQHSLTWSLTAIAKAVAEWQRAKDAGELDEEDEEDGANVDLDSQRKGKAVVLKTSTRQTIFLPVIGLVDAEDLKPGDLVGVNKDSYLILEALPAEYDSRVKTMEVDEKQIGARRVGKECRSRWSPYH